MSVERCEVSTAVNLRLSRSGWPSLEPSWGAETPTTTRCLRRHWRGELTVWSLETRTFSSCPRFPGSRFLAQDNSWFGSRWMLEAPLGRARCAGRVVRTRGYGDDRLPPWTRRAGTPPERQVVSGLVRENPRDLPVGACRTIEARAGSTSPEANVPLIPSPANPAETIRQRGAAPGLAATLGSGQDQLGVQ